MKAECEHGLDTRLPCGDCQKAYEAENAPSLDSSPPPCSPYPFDGNWRCKCGWMTTDIEYVSIRFDAPCPRCGSRWSTFSQIKSVANAKVRV